MGERRSFARRLFRRAAPITQPSSHDGEGAVRPGPEWMAVCRLDSLREEGRRVVHVERHEVVLFVSDADVVAVKNQCPHRDVPLDDAIIDDGCLTCTWHGWRFELSSGNHQTAFRPRRGLTTYPVQVLDGVVWVARQPTVSTPPRLPSRDPISVAVSPRYL